MQAKPIIQAFFDEPTNSVSYLVADPATGDAAVIDPVLSFDPASGKIDANGAKRILAFADENRWRIAMILETHAHADHLSAAAILKAATGAPICIGAHIVEVQKIFAPVFGFDELRTDGADFDRLFRDGEHFNIGALDVEVMHVPGHTPADIAYRIADTLFVGDTLFMPDYGSARTDFPGGDARQLYGSIRRIFSLPEVTRLFLCHDYKAPGRDAYCWEISIAAQKQTNIHVHDGITEDAFVRMREARDATLAAPRLLLPAIQVNIRAGRLPPAAANGVHYLRIPVAGTETAALT